MFVAAVMLSPTNSRRRALAAGGGVGGRMGAASVQKPSRVMPEGPVHPLQRASVARRRVRV